MRRLWIVLSALGVGCGSSNSLETRQECNPLGGESCVLPWPSSLYAVDDSATVTGRRVDIPEGALPTNVDGFAVSPTLFNSHDGFSPDASIITAFVGGVDPSNLVHYSNFPASLTEASPTILLNLDTGDLVEHFAEIDMQAADEPDQQAFYIRPSKMLAEKTRYAVAIRKTLKARDGSELAIPEGFQAILDGTETGHERLEKVRPRYEQIFAGLAQHGIDRSDLVTAWDFTTGSREAMRQDVLAARDAAMPAMGSVGSNLSYTVEEDGDHNDSRIARRIEGEYDAPLFLTLDGRFNRETVMARDERRMPLMQGMYKSPFLAIVPECALDGREPVPIMIYGHGLLGSMDEITTSAIRRTTAELCVVAVGTDMRGMSSRDLQSVAFALNNLNKSNALFDGLVQGVINHLALVEAVRGPMAETLFVDGSGNSIVDTSRIFYYGISQGGIFGGTHCAWSPVIERCVLQVNAISFTMILERSLDWPIHRTVLLGAYPRPLDVVLNMQLLQMLWDTTDPVSVADAVLVPGAIPGVPDKQILMSIAVADDEVANMGSEYAARTMGLPTLGPSPVEPYDIPVLEGPLDSALVYYDYGLGHTIPLTNEPPEDNEVHALVRKQRAHIEMMRIFLDTGEIVQTCTAENGCDCVNDGCGGEVP